MVVHSTTKYLNGHADVVGGAVLTRDDVVSRAKQELPAGTYRRLEAPLAAEETNSSPRRHPSGR